jgi:hypothetical protein
MGCLFSIIRAAAGLVLGVVIFVGFLFFLILNNFSDRLLSADFYRDTIAAEDTYNRIYDEVLVDDELKEKTAELLGDIKVVDHQEIVDLLREIMPPSYIQQEIEGTIDRTIAYINEDVDVLEAYIDLTVPLDNVKPVMFAYIDGRLDKLRVDNPGTVSCSVNGMTTLAEEYLTKYIAISGGEIPLAMPSLQALDPLCRQLLFATSFDLLLASPDLSQEMVQGLRSSRDAMRQPFEGGDTIGVLKVAARALAGPLIDAAIVEVKNDLSEGNRLDLIHQIAKWDVDVDVSLVSSGSSNRSIELTKKSEADIREDIEKGRDWLSNARGLGDLTSLIMVIGGAVLMGLVFFPTLSGMLRWPGIALLITGAFFFVVGKIAESQVPDRLTDVIETGADKVSSIPPSVTDLGGDILLSFGAQLTDGFVAPSLTLLILGGILLGSSFFTIILGKFVPFVK